ncbi:hypothetical protein RB597_005333 [Gaeumannomyces tritici]
MASKKMTPLPPRTIRIGMLNPDTPVPNVRSKFESYGAVFHQLLVEAAARVAPHVQVRSEQFDVVRGEYPSRPEDYDLLLVAGSSASAYEDAEWIRTLDKFLSRVYSQHPQVRLFGSCFGHQILCQALLGKHGAVVEKDPKGWEIGVHTIHLTPEFRAALGRESHPALSQRPPTPEEDDNNHNVVGDKNGALKQDTLRLQFVHADHVRLPEPPQQRLPPGWVLVGSTKHCAVQGVYLPARVLTYQGHFEFDRFINGETLRVFGASWDPRILQSALEQIDSDDDAAAAADMVARFLLEEGVGEEGLLTPPVSD